MGQTHGEVSEGTTFRIRRVSAHIQAPGDLGVKYVSNTVIKTGLMTLPFDSGPKLPCGAVNSLVIRFTWGI